MTTADDARAIRNVFRRWWYGLTDAGDEGFNRDRAAIARLRRLDLVNGPDGLSPDLIGALVEEPFRRLLTGLQPHHDFHDLRDDRAEDLVTAVATLARIREDAAGTTARLLGGRDDVDRVMKEGRFLALMRAETAADLFDHARRLPALLGGRAPVGELGASLLLWRTNPWVRRNWARDYYHLDLSGRQGGPSETPASGPAPAEA